MLGKAKARILEWMRRLGYEVMPRGSSPTMDGALARASRRVEVRTVIDVGASDGRWSRGAMRHFPRAQYLLVEAQEAAHGDALRAWRAADRRIEVVLAAAGDHAGEVTFDTSDAFGGGVLVGRSAAGGTVLPMTTIDAEVTRRALEPPFLLKLDTHGFEVPILDGATRTLKETGLLVIEAYNFDLGPGALRFPDLCRLLEQRGFRCVDLADPMWRPRDGSLWQLDLFFVPATRPEFTSNTYE
jgi:FkbM family methyltransferase